MNTTAPQHQVANFDLFRLSKSQAVVDISPKTIKAYQKAGFRLYGSRGAVFVSKMELDTFIRSGKWEEYLKEQEAKK